MPERTLSVPPIQKALILTVLLVLSQPFFIGLG